MNAMKKCFAAALCCATLLPAFATTIYTAEERAERAEENLRRMVEQAPLVVLVQKETSVLCKQLASPEEQGKAYPLCRYSSCLRGQLLEVLKGELPPQTQRFEYRTGGVSPMPAPTPEQERGVLITEHESRVYAVSAYETKDGVLYMKDTLPLPVTPNRTEKVRALLRAASGVQHAAQAESGGGDSR